MFEKFFGYVIDPERAVSLFTWHHYLLIGCAIIAIYLPFQFSKKIRQSRYEHKIRNGAFLWLIILEIVYHAHNWFNGEISFPLHICSFAVIMSLGLLKTNSQRIFEYVFFFGVLGGFMALVVPFSYGFPYYNIRYYHFIFIHMTIIMIPLYYFHGYNFRVTKRALYKTFLMVLLVAPIIYNINLLLSRLSKTTNVNYWFVTYIPEHVAFIFSNQWIYLGVLLSLIYVSQVILFKVTHRDKSSELNV